MTVRRPPIRSWPPHLHGRFGVMTGLSRHFHGRSAQRPTAAERCPHVRSERWSGRAEARLSGQNLANSGRKPSVEPVAAWPRLSAVQSSFERFLERCLPNVACPPFWPWTWLLGSHGSRRGRARPPRRFITGRQLALRAPGLVQFGSSTVNGNSPRLGKTHTQEIHGGTSHMSPGLHPHVPPSFAHVLARRMHS